MDAPLTINGPSNAAPAPALSPADLDAVTRTVMTEAGTPDGWGGVANVVRNRMAAGGFGASPSDIVQMPRQFEVWSNGRAQAVDPSSPDYQRAARVVAGVFDGSLPDNTSGATFFYSPASQAALAGDGRTMNPSFAKGHTADIAGNSFFAPGGAVARKGGAPAGNPAPASPAPPAGAAATPSPASPPPSAFDSLAVEMPVGTDQGSGSPPATPAAQPASAKPGTAPASASPFDALAVEMPRAAAPAGSASAPQAADRGSGVAAMAGFLDGVPIAGPALLGGSERLGALIGTVRNGDAYADELSRIQGEVGTTDAAHPIASGAGRVGGAVVGMAPAMMAAPEAFGLEGSSMLGQMGWGALSNGAVGGADSAARGQNPLTGAGMGALVGGAAPPVAKLAGNALGGLFGGGTGLLQAGVNKVTTGSSSGVPGVSMPAARYMLDGLNADGIDTARNALIGLGDHGMILDTGPGSRGNAMGMLGPATPEASVITNALAARDASSNSRVMSALRSSIGPDRDPEDIVARMAAARSDATTPVYGRVLANAPPVDVSGVVAGIDHDLQTAVGAQARGLNFLRNNLVVSPGGVDAAGNVIPPTYETNAQRLLYLRQELDKALGGQQEGLGLRPSAVTRADHSITEARAALDAALKSQVPGLAEVDGVFAHSADVQNAVDNGFNRVLGARGPHPDTFAAARAAMDPDVAAAENAGIAGRIYRNFGSGTQRDVVKLDRTLAGGDDGYATRNLATAFGQDPVDNLLDTVRQEKTFANSSAELTGKSNTNRLGAALKRGQDTEPGSLNLTAANPGGVMMQAGKSLIADPLMKIIMANPNASRNMEIARMLTARGVDAQRVLDGLAALDSQFRGASALRSNIGGSVNALLGVGAPSIADTSGAWANDNPLLQPPLTIRGPRR